MSSNHLGFVHQLRFYKYQQGMEWVVLLIQF